MKECPKCKKQINEKAKVCPYCGQTFGYQRIQKGKKAPRKKNNFFALFLTFAIASILTFTYLFDESYFNQLAVYLTDEDFAILNAEDQEYIDAIASFEKGLGNALDSDTQIIKSYSFGMSSDTYAYFYPVYDILFTDESSMYLELEYDLDSDNDYVDIHYTMGEYSDFQSMVDAINTSEQFQTVISYLSPETSLTQECTDSFLELEEEFELNKEVLGNYGISVRSSNDTSICTFVITQSAEGYYLKQQWTGLLIDDIFEDAI